MNHPVPLPIFGTPFRPQTRALAYRRYQTLRKSHTTTRAAAYNSSIATSSDGIAIAPQTGQLTVVNSHRARMLLPGVADLETLRYFAGLVGEEEALDQTRTTGAGGQSRSTARRRRPLIAPEALRQLPDGDALLLYGRLAPTRVKLRMWFADRRLRRLAQGVGA